MPLTGVDDFVTELGLKMLHLNTRSMFKKREELFEVLEGVDIATFSETWFHEQYDDELLVWPGMRLFRLDRSKKKKEGEWPFM